HRHVAFGVELDDHVRALVDGPDVVVLVHAHRVRERPRVEALADLADELAVLVELEELARRAAVRRAHRAVGARVDEDVALRVDRDAGVLAEVQVRRQLEEVGDGVERNLRHRLLRAQHRKCTGDDQRRDGKTLHKNLLNTAGAYQRCYLLFAIMRSCWRNGRMSLDVEAHTESHEHKTGHKWLDMTVAFSALFLSVVSLGVAIVHGRTMEKMAEANARLVAANSWPFLSYGPGTVTTNGVARIHMQVFNAGVGPAKIEAAELKWKGVAYASNEDFLKACCDFDPTSATKPDSDLLLHEVLRAGQNIRFLEFSQPANPA